ncbi:MAG TPA: hypothetical protein VNB06_15885 [Thermoanaerobaculia bacterium]|nr:hypothetical protein [Thermoanaerobaculia bacterium]
MFGSVCRRALPAAAEPRAQLRGFHDGLLAPHRDLEQELEWSEAAVSMPLIGRANFATLSTKGLVLARLGRVPTKRHMTLATARI